MADSLVIKCEPGIQKSSAEENKTFSCWRCSYSSDRRSSLRTHVKGVHKASIAKFECCGINFPDGGLFEHHTVECHPPRYICKSCGFGFFQAADLKRHMASKSCSQNLLSTSSDHATSCNYHLDQQVESHEERDDDSSSHSPAPIHPSLSTPAPADFLQQDSSSLDVGLSDTFFACSTCSFKTKWRHSLRRHQRRVCHLQPKSSAIDFDAKKGFQKKAATIRRQRFMCKTCNKVFSNSSLLRSHQVAHPSYKSFKCSLCDYAAIRLGILNKHVRRKHKILSPDHLPTEDSQASEGDAVVPRIRLLRNSRRPSAGREKHEPEHGDIVKDESMHYGSLSRQTSFRGAPFDPLVNPVNGNREELNPRTSLVRTESKPVSIEARKEKRTLQDSSIFSCTKCSHSTKWRCALVRHMKNHERQDRVSSPISLSLTRKHVPTAPESAHLVLLPPGRIRRSGRLSVKPTASSPSEILPQSLSEVKSIHGEATWLRSRLSLVETVPSLLSLLFRLLELSSYATSHILVALEVKVRFEAIECFEYVWNASKMAIIRWEQLNGETRHDASLSAVQYVYGTLPVFTNWEKNEHLDKLGNVILLILNTVKNWK